MSQRRSRSTDAAPKKAASVEERNKLIAARDHEQLENKWGREALLAAREERRCLAKTKVALSTKREVLLPKPRPSSQAKRAAREHVVVERSHYGNLTRRSVMVLCAIAVIVPLFLFRSEKTTTKSVRSSSQTQQPKVLHLLDATQLEDEDLFSASWLQPVSTFIGMDTSSDALKTTDAGSYLVIHEHPDKVRMTLDWLDLSVEHLSDWIDTMNIFTTDDNIPFHVIISKLHNYISSIWINKNNVSMKDTIAVIAFEPVESKRKPEVAMELSASLLAATVASLVQAGFGRVVVVGYKSDDSELADEAIRLLLTLAPVGGTTSKIGSTEVGYVQAATEDVISKLTPINIVKGALTGLQNALNGQLDAKRQRQWLGSSLDRRDRALWKYVYLTESDSILQTKPSALAELKAALDQGFLLAPHRLQPLPHEYDLVGMKNRNKYVHAKGNFSSILELNPLEGAVCCDELDKYYKPWKDHPNFCSSLWWQCGFNDQQDHSRLEEYPLMKLKPGMDIISLAANHNGRRCKPSFDGICTPPKYNGDRG